jgi:hypothetical protein
MLRVVSITVNGQTIFTMPPPTEVPPSTKRETSRTAHAWLVERSLERRAVCIAARARFGFQQMPRLPCYRATRTR